MRQGRRMLAAILLMSVGWWVAPNALAQPPSLPAEMLEDAALHDVFFLDANRGWAVGDRGVIWTTEDGGRRWQLADSPVNCRLDSVHFVDERNGWAVGGWTHPYSHRTQGVVLRTENGGRRWTRLSAETLPKLSRVKFFDLQQGWAVGLPSAMYPSGVFRTEDGGRSWMSFPTTREVAWLAGDFVDPQQGVVVGRGGLIANLTRTSLVPLPQAETGLRQPRSVKITGRQRLWLAGDGGLLWYSADGGQRWLAPKLPVEQSTLEQIDFRAIAVRDNMIWVVGNPGSCLLRSADHGQSWQLVPTGHTLPLHNLTFVDAERGWAVGPLGTILSTHDGGTTWQRQHSGGQRAAVLGLFSDASTIPLELFTRACGDEGFLGVVESLTRRDVELPTAGDASRDERVSAGVIAAGGTYANSTWRFPLRQMGLKLSASAIAQGWSLTHGRDGAAACEEYAVLRLRQWRPEIVVTQAADPRGLDPLSHVVNQIVLKAVVRAADPTAYPDQIHVLGLSPWRTKKLFAATNLDASATITLDTTQLATRLGRTVQEHTSICRGLIDDRWSPVAKRRGFELLLTEVPRPLAGRDLFSGLSLAPASEARRALSQASATSIVDLRRVTQVQRTIEILLTRAGDDEQDLGGWLAQIDNLTRELPESSGGEALFLLAQRYQEIGSYGLAAETRIALVHRYPNHGLAEAALMWVVQYLASEEAEIAFESRSGLEQPAIEQVALASATNSDLLPKLHPQLTVTHFDSRVERAGWDTTEVATNGLDRLLQQVAGLQQTRPAWSAEPSVRCSIAAAYRRSGQLNEARRLYQQLAGSQPQGIWRQTAQGELWLATRSEKPPKSVLICPLQTEQPLLDGRLDEQLWTQAAAVPLTSRLADDAAWPATVKLARDHEYLYLGVQCRKPVGLAYTSSDQPRGRDPLLKLEDRVEFLFDIDRDYASCFKFTVDHRGWTGEACWGDTRWNPQWFVAATSNDDSWTVEAAIPLAELGRAALGEGEVWACRVQRIVPQVGFQAWAHPAAAVELPSADGASVSGLLIFD